MDKSETHTGNSKWNLLSRYLSPTEIPWGGGDLKIQEIYITKIKNLGKDLREKR